jgi:signal transduction histidine kinase
MAETAADVVVGLVWLVAGGLVCQPREHRRIGLLMVATGATWLAGSLVASLVLLHRGPLANVLLAYPGGVLGGPVERVVVAAAYLEGAILPIGRAPLSALVLAAAILAVAAWRCLRETGAVRRSRTAPLGAAALIASVLAAAAIARLGGVSFGAWPVWIYDAILVTTALTLSVDVRAGRWGRAAVAGLVVDVGTGGTDTLTRKLARAIGDPSLTVAYALDDGVTFVDESGRPVELPVSDSVRAVTRIDDADRTLAVLVHDRTALRDGELLTGARAALRVAVVNVRLQADVRRRVGEVERSRRRLLNASDQERRRFAAELEGDVIPCLDDAAQVVALARDGDEDSEVGDLERRLADASADLRRLAIGLRPMGLEERGLAYALRVLVADSPLDVKLTVPAERFDGDVEATAWFVCAEGLANVIKHAGATRAEICIATASGRLSVEVTDDGGGGADLALGSGLRGLAARVEARGGVLSIGLAAGGGTRLVADLPVAAASTAVSGG